MTTVETVKSDYVPQEVVETLLCTKGENAKAFHDDAEMLLSSKWMTRREYWVPDRGDGSAGRVDLVVYYNGLPVGIELDNKTPRKKSLFKLENHFRHWVVVTRNGYYPQRRFKVTNAEGNGE